MTRAEIQAIVQDAVRVQLARQQQELETTNQRLAADLQKQQTLALTPVAAQLRYLQSAQSVVWKQAQEQSALVELIARNTLGQEAAQPSRP
jgi:TRAP-type C4-dicarboxylate transport system substrate-binding protein